MAGFLAVPAANADDDLTGAVLDTIATTPQTITGLTNGTAYVAMRVSDESAEFTPVAADTTAPTISSSDPADNSTDHPIADNIVITFDENIQFGTGNIVLRENNGGWADLETFSVTTEVGTGAGQVSISGAVLTINPTSDLTAGREYAIRVDATAIDDTATSPNSFAGIADDTTLSFTTAAAAGGISIVGWAPVSGTSADLTALNAVGSAAGTGDGGSVAENDVVHFFIAIASQVGRGGGATGYTEQGSEINQLGSTYDVREFQHQAKLMGSTPDTTADMFDDGSANHGHLGIAVVTRGQDTTNLTTATANSTTEDPGSVTPVGAGSIVFATCAAAGATPPTISGVPSGYTEIGGMTADAAQTDGAMSVAYFTGWTSGAEDPGTFTVSGNDAAASKTAAVAPA